VVVGELDGKVAVVTGGASGIGLATARRLAAAGAAVVIGDLSEEPGRSAAEETGGRFVRIDVAEPGEWEALVAGVVEEYGGIDIAHLNAGIVTGTPDIRAVTDERYRAIMRANVDGVILGTRAVLPAIEERGGGAIVATASLAGLVGLALDPVYTATKHAVVGFVRAMAPQLEGRHITFNAVCPGMVRTPLLDEATIGLLEDAGFPLIDPDVVAEAVYGCVTGTGTGQAIMVQADVEPAPYRFAGVMGPGGEHAGEVPPIVQTP
jgi:NAD(P)-dependent dehydrogenase (short-subunit alcohol dehydrogenase family)